MLRVNKIFERIEKLTQEEGQCEFLSAHVQTFSNKGDQEQVGEENLNTFQILQSFLQKIINTIDELASEIINDNTILISVKNQKLLRTCFQLITSLGISPCLIPGLGISLSKRCSSAAILPTLNFSDEQKYEMLLECTDFFTRSYKVPVLKNIIITLHLCDYLAALIQLSFAPLKKPGTYNNFVMTNEMYDKVHVDQQKYSKIYDHLVSNCFQPILMKELLILQSVKNPSPPAFVKRVIAKELSQRLLMPGGLLSLIRCFIESYDIDTGFEWKKIDMICRLVTAKHGSNSEVDYLNNICAQLNQILSLNNTHYLVTAVACVLSLNEKYTQSSPVKDLVKEIFQALDYEKLISKSNLPGTVILSAHEIEHKVYVLHACVCITKLDWAAKLLTPNLYILFLLGVKCTKSDDMKTKIRDIILKCLEKNNKVEVSDITKIYLFGKETSTPSLQIEEYDSGMAIKVGADHIDIPNEDRLLFFLHLFKAATDSELVTNIFEISLLILIELSVKKQRKRNNETLLAMEDEPVLLDKIDEQYAIILQLLSEISTSPKVITSLKTNPSIVFNFIEHFITNNDAKSNDECITIALVLLNTILTNSKSDDFEKRFNNLIPVLMNMSKDTSSFNHILCDEALLLITSELPQQSETPFGKALSNVYDNLLPVRAHGIIELTKLIDAADSETISKKHYIFCLLQEQLKDPDSYIYLSAVNGLASLCTHCTDDVLHVLCQEFLQVSTKRDNIETINTLNKISELKMKIGDVIVKVTKRLGEMAVVHKTILLNTMLCGCRDEDPLIRTSALSNLAEIALVIHYRIGSIIYEVLLCVWSIIETDKAIECRRAAVMVISSLIKGLGKETLVELKENLLPIYRSLKALYSDSNEDSVVRLHAQIALEELNDVVNQFLFPELKMEGQIFVLDKPEDVLK